MLGFTKKAHRRGEAHECERWASCRLPAVEVIVYDWPLEEPYGTEWRRSRAYVCDGHADDTLSDLRDEGARIVGLTDVA